MIYPKAYLKNVREITTEFLEKNQIKALILDVDNTLIDYNKVLPEETIKWCKKLKEKGVKFCIVSNTNKKEKAETVAKKLGIPYFYFAKKPFKSGLKKAINLLNESNENIAVVGDQIFTDVIGANRLNMFSILVEPIDKKDILITKIKRPIENLIIKRYQERNKKCI